MQEFSGLRAILFPIHRHELKKFLPLCFMMFFILFNYQIMRDTKDTLVVSAAGAEALSLIKLIGTVPGAILIMLAYSKMSNIFSKEQLFYVTLIPFLVFFGLFAYVIYPNREFFHPSTMWVNELSATYPRFSTLFHVFGSWSYAVFYVLSELWGSVVISLLFWQFANDIVRMKEAKRFYSLFGAIANFALITAGITITYFSEIRDSVAPGIDSWGMTLNYLMGAIVVSGAAVACTYRWIHSNVLTDSLLYDYANEKKDGKKKPKLSLKESFSFLVRSKHLFFISLIVICYGISQNVIEGVWKDQIKKVYENENSYNAFMGRLSLVTGMITITFMIIGTNIVRLFGWRLSASLTPLMIFLTGTLFFTFVTFKDGLETWTVTTLAMTPTALAVWLGFFQSVLSKATKYSLFDPTKEMSYIPLDQESKVKGKAAVDVVGGRLGKSGGAVAQQTLLFVTASSLVSIAPYLAIVCLIGTTVWFFAIGKLNTSLQQLQGEQQGELPEKQPVHSS